MRKPVRSTNLLPLAFALPLSMAAPAVADPTVGLGVTFAFGVGAQVDTGVGLRAFNRDRRNSTVASVGLDYMLASQQFRATVGVAALRRNAFFGVDLGYGFGTGALDLGPSVGFVSTSRAPAP
ncbi:MAG: hypothetical protein ACXIUW_11255 [Roseinatronobacter sp.]